jgi:hypothetical protein
MLRRCTGWGQVLAKLKKIEREAHMQDDIDTIPPPQKKAEAKPGEVNEAAIIKQTTDLTVQAQALVVKTDAQYIVACEFRKTLKGMINTIIADFKESKAKAYGAWQAITQQEKKHTDKVTAAMKLVDQKLGEYQDAKEAERKKAEAEARDAAAAAAAKLLEKSEKAAAKGNTAQAQELEAQAQEAAVPVTSHIAAPKVDGLNSGRKVIKSKVVNAKLVPRELCEPSSSLITAKIKLEATEDTLPEIPGVEIWRERSQSSRGSN